MFSRCGRSFFDDQFRIQRNPYTNRMKRTNWYVYTWKDDDCSSARNCFASQSFVYELWHESCRGNKWNPVNNLLFSHLPLPVQSLDSMPIAVRCVFSYLLLLLSPNDCHEIDDGGQSNAFVPSRHDDRVHRFPPLSVSSLNWISLLFLARNSFLQIRTTSRDRVVKSIGPSGVLVSVGFFVHQRRKDGALCMERSQEHAMLFTPARKFISRYIVSGSRYTLWLPLQTYTIIQYRDYAGTPKVTRFERIAFGFVFFFLLPLLFVFSGCRNGGFKYCRRISGQLNLFEKLRELCTIVPWHKHSDERWFRCGWSA